MSGRFRPSAFLRENRADLLLASSSLGAPQDLFREPRVKAKRVVVGPGERLGMQGVSKVLTRVMLARAGGGAAPGAAAS